ncbi:DNA recombination protein RecO [Tamlana nanhaiensis]|uniref:DNA repair protein RecO n=1 Tax=Neotamlana nanhaiensis TaxID=1382798 RepID=A0A0D7VWY5_9FLAO|nr:DNA repair protein RecO [Tamlana nanhaiensis]KJD31289.1 DNA recombination protein RecO [Tamlana nanhaiensis]
MLLTTNAIVLSKFRYKDNDLIVKCYTQEKGVLSVLLRGVFKSKKGGSKIAYYQLLSQIQIVINYNTKSSLHGVKETKPIHIYTSLHTNVLKSAIVMFLAEVLSTALKEEEQNKTLYTYLEHTLLWLDNQQSFANFHLLFLLNLTKYLGFYPDVSLINLPYFNLYEGEFQDQVTDKFSVSNENLILLKALLGTKFDALNELKINVKQRQSFLSMLLLYFDLHLGAFKKPKSLQIFNQVFS